MVRDTGCLFWWAAKWYERMAIVGQTAGDVVQESGRLPVREEEGLVQSGGSAPGSSLQALHRL